MKESVDVSTEPIVVEKEADLDPAAEKAIEVLEAGGVVVLPTETVYGMVALSDDEDAVSRIYELKDRPADRPIARLISGLEKARELGDIPDQALPLLRRYWPGPLTLVVPRTDDPDETIGLRHSAHPLVQSIVDAVGPLAATSANRHGEPPIVSGEQARESFGEEVELVIDGGTTTLQEASTVLLFTDSGYEVVREGILSREMIDRVLQTLILFVCTGNTCRSPMAEAMFRKKLADALDVKEDELLRHGYLVASAGTGASRGASAADNAVKVMKQRGLDISDHESQPVSLDLVEEADFIYALTDAHRRGILFYFPKVKEKIRLLDPEGVADPVGGDRKLYKKTADQIEARLDDVLKIVLAAPKKADE